MSHYGGYEDLSWLPELYDAIPLYNTRADVRYYVDACRNSSGEVLELGCGTGRILIPAAEAGSVITGLDQSIHMLERCRGKLAMLPGETQKRVTLVHADMTHFQLHRRFALAIVPFRPLQHLITVAEQLSFLGCVRQHLEPEGKIILDVFNPDLNRLTSPPHAEEIEDTPEIELTGGRRFQRMFRILGVNLAEQVTDVELIYYIRNPGGETQRMVQSFPMRYFFRFELEHLLARSGFQVTGIHGDLDGGLFTSTSREMIFTAMATVNDPQ